MRFSCLHGVRFAGCMGAASSVDACMHGNCTGQQWMLVHGHLAEEDTRWVLTCNAVPCCALHCCALLQDPELTAWRGASMFAAGEGLWQCVKTRKQYNEAGPGKRDR